jgi:hypothetical protein
MIADLTDALAALSGRVIIDFSLSMTALKQAFLTLIPTKDTKSEL